MATALMSPYVPAGDETKMDDAVALLHETGHPISKSTLERQCRARGVTLTKRGRANYASWSDVLIVHAAWVDSRDDLP
ncbi:hypothetical protein ABZ784_28870 [Streptomyces tendae]|uniref:hypothetical protein n=1 Tax=Streptomyces tendae TaxID=1932 RepID=UPI0034019E7E